MSTDAFIRYFGYRPGRSFFYELDPRAKIILYGTFLLIAIAWTDPIFLLLALSILIAFYRIAGESFKNIAVLPIVPSPGYVLILIYNLFLFDITAGRFVP